MNILDLMNDFDENKGFTIGLFTTTLDENGEGVEVGYTGYERQVLKFELEDKHARNINPICFGTYIGKKVEVASYGIFYGDELFMFENLPYAKDLRDVIHNLRKDNNLMIWVD